MKITKITAKIVDLDLVKPFKIAIGTISTCATVLVKVETDKGIVGYGEGTSAPFITGETPAIILAAVETLAPELDGLDPWSIGYIHRKMDDTLVGHGAAKAAIDIALYDIMGKDAGLPLYKLLGGVQGVCETDLTIGIDEPAEMAKTARAIADRGFLQIKVKAGEDYKTDIEAIRLIREAVGDGIRLKVDANQGWAAGDAAVAAVALAGYGVEAIEQPVRAWDIEGLAYVRAKSPILIMADESCFTPQDAVKLISRGAVDMINIKLMKCGGLYRAMQINAIAAAAGIPCMLGCMMESRLAIAAAAALISSDTNFHYGDLDSFLELKEGKEVDGGFEFETPFIHLTEAPGHGVLVNA